ncbi:MAG: exodeoxyribonuclease VII small subunit [Bacilli bacterium]|nr:exodeoxyribonuclease VII small subunit [Bacilli bacterium]MDD4795803.1 exodeoxyribonuclease VII small subunit [Bacilli bacterium]
MEKKKFEELMTDLEKIVKELEAGDIDLEVSIEKYTEAMKLVKVCGDKLSSALESVNKIRTENGEFIDFKTEDNQ